MLEEKYVAVETIVDDTDLANRYLDAGWVLLNVCTGLNNSSGAGFHSMLFGWPEGREVVHPSVDLGERLG